MDFAPLELQACGENNFTMKALGLLAFREDLRRRLAGHLAGVSLRPDADVSMLFFSRIGEGFMREAIEREALLGRNRALEALLNDALGLPSELRWRRNADGKLTQPSKWQRSFMGDMLAASGLDPDGRHLATLNFVQDFLNTEPDLVLQWDDHLLLVEIKVLSGEGTAQLERQRRLGEFLGALLGWRSSLAMIGPSHGGRPSVPSCRFASWDEIADLFADVAEIRDYIREFAVFYKGRWQSMVSYAASQPAPTAFDLLVSRAASAQPPEPSAATAVIPTASRDAASGDPWHFSHLGRAYFVRFLDQLRFAGFWPIRYVWTGRTGVPYREKANGRMINPNWMCEDATGARRTRSRGPHQQHAYDAGKMLRWSYDDIAKFFGLDR